MPAGRMRLELALVLAVVLFCAWCAYVLVRLQAANQQHQNQNQNQTAQRPAEPTRVAAANAPAVYFVSPRPAYSSPLAPSYSGWRPPASQPAPAAAVPQQQMAYQLAAEPEPEPEEAEPEEAGEPAGRELEQQHGERSYTEEDEASSERDRLGRPTLTHRRRLVNGRDVPPEPAEQQPADFGELVDEIEDEANQPAGEEAETAAGESQRSLALAPAAPAGQEEEEEAAEEEEVGEGEEQRLPASKRDQHEHQLRESLKSQHWDDDGHSNKTAPSAREEAEAEPTERIEFRDLDLPRGRRTRRQLEANSTNQTLVELLGEPPPPPPLLLGQPGTPLLIEAPLLLAEPAGLLQAANGSQPTELQPPASQPIELRPPASQPIELQASQQVGEAKLGAASSPKEAKRAQKSKGKKKKRSKSRMAESKYKAARAEAKRRRSKTKKGARLKRRKQVARKAASRRKEFKGATRGAKLAAGKGARGAKKGALYYKDKGYKKKGFKRAYQKVESGDHKTYFDEFRDKDHKKRWKNFKDKREFSQSKKWAGKERKKFNNYQSSARKDKRTGSGRWKERAHSRYHKDYQHKAAKAKKSASKKRKKHQH